MQGSYGLGRLVIVLGLSSFALAVGCGDEPLRPKPGAPCLKNSDCKDPLSCTFGLCHESCAIDRDCPSGQTCVFDPHERFMRVCQLPKEETCSLNSECPNELVCGGDSKCRNECETSKDCATKTQKCIDRVCAEPFDLEKSSGGELKLKQSQAPEDRDSGTREGAGESGGTAGKSGSGGKAGSGDEGGRGGAGAGAGGRGGAGAGASGRGGAGGGTGTLTNPVIANMPPPPSMPKCDGTSNFAGFNPSNIPSDFAWPTDLKPFENFTCGLNTNDHDPDKPTAGPHWITHCTSFEPPALEARVVKLVDGREVAVLFYSQLILPVGAKLEFTGDRPLILIVKGRVEINGTVTAFADAMTGWYGGGAPVTMGDSRQGRSPIDEAPGGGRPGSNKPATGLGPGGGGFCGKGGAGSTDMMGTPAAVGGDAYGNVELLPLVGGSSGGNSSGMGGHGGAALQIVAGMEIVIGDTGSINAGGGSGKAAAGGGSGGAILLEAPSVTVRGILAANGGGGADYASSFGGQDGQASDVAADGSLTGGKGSAGGSLDGDPGNATATKLALSGGGGGSGRIRINTGCGGKLTVASAAIISPHRGTACYSDGALR